MRRHADRHPQPEPLPHRQREDDLRRRLRDGRPGALLGRRLHHRPDGQGRPDQSRLRRRALGHARDGQGDDGHGRGLRRASRDPGGRGRDRQPAPRRDVDARARGACSSRSPAARTSPCSRSTRRRPASARKSIPTPTSSSARPSRSRWKASSACRWSRPASRATSPPPPRLWPQSQLGRCAAAASRLGRRQPLATPSAAASGAARRSRADEPAAAGRLWPRNRPSRVPQPQAVAARRITITAARSRPCSTTPTALEPQAPEDDDPACRGAVHSAARRSAAARMPRVEDFPPVAQRQIEAQRDPRGRTTRIAVR